MIRGGNLSSDSAIRLDDNGLAFLAPEKAAEFSKSTVYPGDLVFTCWGTIDQIGLIDDSATYGRYVISNKQMKASPDPKKADSEFLYYLFSGDDLQSEIRSQSIGSSIPGFNLGQLRSLRFWLPPLSEQRAIAAALTEVDALVAALDALIEKKRAVKTAAMQRLLTGRQRLAGFEGAWETFEFGEVSRPRKDRVIPSESGHSFCLELEHIAPGTGELSGSESGTNVTTLRAVFQPGDVLFSKLRAYLRKHWLADREGVCSTEIWVLSVDSMKVTPTYLYHLVTTDQFIDIASTAHGTHMPRSDWSVVKNHKLSLPPIAEQRAIAATLRDMDAEVAALASRRDKTRQVKTGMMQELLTGRTRLV